MSRPNSLSSKKPIIVAGPTGVGKTAFAAELALQIGGEIVGADAYQVYAGLEILTSQPEAALRERVPHHLVGFLSPTETFDAARFVALAQEKIAKISARGKVPILTGGTGLYIKALTHGLAKLPPANEELRGELALLSHEECRRRLEEADQLAGEFIDLQNPRRVLRALEIFLLSGGRPSELRREWKEKATPAYDGFLLVRTKEELAERIAANVRSMFDRGVIAEVRSLPEISVTAAQAIGWREIQALLRGEISEAECREQIVLATRQYAKRQLTWFRNQFTFTPIDLTATSTPLESVRVALNSPGAA